MTDQVPALMWTEDLNWSFDNNESGLLHVIDGLSLTFEKGKLYALVGPSGCGKSTLLSILAGADKYRSASVKWHEPNRPLLTAFIEQDIALLPWRSAFQNACLGAELRGKLTPTVVQRIRDDFDHFELRGFEDHYPEQLSGGMQQRIAIIRALQSKPQILFCDEPFSAIDFVTRLRLNTDFKKRCRLARQTTVFVTHNIEEAIYLADVIYVLSRRPCRLVKAITPQIDPTLNAVQFRQSAKFGEHFDEIWNLLQ